MSALKLSQRPSLIGLWALALVDSDLPDLLMTGPASSVLMISFF